MSRYCLDTAAYSNFKRGDQKVIDLLDAAESIAVPVIVIGELSAGFVQGSRAAQNHAELEEFLAMPVTQVLPVDRHVARIFGDLVTTLKRKGRPLPSNDIWIAATSISAGTTLLTYDGHFRQIDQVSVMILD